MNVPLKVLVVEDMRSMRLLLRGLLPTALGGHVLDVQEACDGEEGLERARHSRPDFIISDVEMPRKTGMELCQSLKADPRLKDIPVVLWSSHTMVKELALEAGAVAFMAKPLRPADLEQAMTTVLRRVEQARAA